MLEIGDKICYRESRGPGANLQSPPPLVLAVSARVLSGSDSVSVHRLDAATLQLFYETLGIKLK